MKAVMLSIRPEWCSKIASGKKTIEVRKTRPKLKTPFKGYIYCSCKGTLDPHKYLEVHADDGKIYNVNGKVMGEFTCDYIKPYGMVLSAPELMNLTRTSCLSVHEFCEYAGEKPKVYGWHISNLAIYDKPKELSAFTQLKETRFGGRPLKLTRPPQSWQYVEELEEIT